MDITKLDIGKELNLEELQHFFSKTGEFVVVKTKPHTFQISFNGNMGLHKTLVYMPTLQTLIRDIVGVSYLDGWEQRESKIK